MISVTPPPKNYKISSAFSYNFKSALTVEVEQNLCSAGKRKVKNGANRCGAMVTSVHLFYQHKIKRLKSERIRAFFLTFSMETCPSQGLGRGKTQTPTQTPKGHNGAENTRGMARIILLR